MNFFHYVVYLLSIVVPAPAPPPVPAPTPAPGHIFVGSALGVIIAAVVAAGVADAS